MGAVTRPNGDLSESAVNDVCARLTNGKADEVKGWIAANGVDALNLDGRDIGPEGARHLASVLETNGTLKVLHLGGCGIGDDGAQAICGALLLNRTLTKLSLERNSISGACTEAILRMLDRSALTTLDLRQNNFLADHQEQIREAAERVIGARPFQLLLEDARPSSDDPAVDSKRAADCDEGDSSHFRVIEDEPDLSRESDSDEEDPIGEEGPRDHFLVIKDESDLESDSDEEDPMACRDTREG
jgi:hypothetical protein